LTEQFEDQLLDEFAHTFYGYGNAQAQYWFVGMEEGGGNSFAEINKRLNTWAKRGKHELEDVAEYHADIGITNLFNEKPKLQSTWNKLIRIVLSGNGQEPTTEQVREYQRLLLGRPTGNTCLVELLPLPSPSTGHWLYAQHSALPYLADRETYKRAFLELRIAHLRQRIIEQQPKTVVFYSFNYQEYWQKIAGVELLPIAEGIYMSNNGPTRSVMTKHPATRGITNAYFHQVGNLISSNTGNGQSE
jgi:hypothetical protein